MEPQSLNVRNGFRVLKQTYLLPQELSNLDAQAKRTATICNLFINHQLAVSDIARVLDESHGRVIDVLIQQGVVEERRSVSRNPKATPSRPGFSSRFKTRSTT